MPIRIVCRSYEKRCGIFEAAQLLARRLQAHSISSQFKDFDVTFIEYEPSLYRGIPDLIQEIERLSGFVVVDVHSGQDSEVNEIKWFAIIGTKTPWIPGTIHLPLLSENVLEESHSGDRLCLGSFGFALPHKRYEDIIDISARLDIPALILASYADATPQIDQLSVQYISFLRDYVKGKDVELITDFLEIHDILKRLSNCSHLVSMMQDVGSTSASLRLMALAGRPVIALRSRMAREINAIEVNSPDDITLDFLKRTTDERSTFCDGFDNYVDLLNSLIAAKQLEGQIIHHDGIYLSDYRQKDRIQWIAERCSGRTIEIGIGNGWSTNQIRAVAGTEIRADRLAYASARFPHIDFYLMDSRIRALPGFTTVVMAEIIEHMPLSQAKSMIDLWAQTNPHSILITTPNAGKEDYDHTLVHNEEHVWFPRKEDIRSLVPFGYQASIEESSGGDFILAEFSL